MDDLGSLMRGMSELQGMLMLLNMGFGVVNLRKALNEVDFTEDERRVIDSLREILLSELDRRITTYLNVMGKGAGESEV